MIYCRLSLAIVLIVPLSARMLQAEPPAKKPDSEASAKGRLPITISKQTTYITEPLRPDGYPDYLAALNQMTSRGVTPENNAAVALIEAFGPDALQGAFDRKFTGEEREAFYKLLGIAPLPEKGDYFVDFYAYLERYAPDALKDRNDAGGWQMPRAHEESMRAVKCPWSKEDCPLVAAWLASIERPLDRIIEASRRPRFFVPLVAHGDRLGSYDMLPLNLPVRGVVRALTRRAMFQVHEGKIQEAWGDLLACHRLARLHGQGPVSAWDCLIAMVCDLMACHGDRQLAHYAKLTPEQVKKFSADLAQLPSLRSQQDNLYLFDRFLFLDAVCATVRGSLKPIDIVPKESSILRGGDTPEWIALRESLTKWIGGGQVDWNQVLHLGNEYFDRVAAVRRKPTFAEQSRGFSTLNKETGRLVAKYRLPHAKTDPEKDNAVKEESPRVVATEGVFIVYWSQLVEIIYPYTERRTAIYMQLAPLSLALSAYRTEHGEYSGKLGALRPKYLDQLPQDPYCDGDFRYRRDGDGYILYSVGPDGKDGGGPRAYPFGQTIREDSDDLGVQVGRAFDEENE